MLRWDGIGCEAPDWRFGADLWHNIQVAQARPPGCAPDLPIWLVRRTGDHAEVRSETGPRSPSQVEEAVGHARAASATHPTAGVGATHRKTIEKDEAKRWRD